jgi:hypothetical protein
MTKTTKKGTRTGLWIKFTLCIGLKNVACPVGLCARA